MRERGGPANESGILFQNTVAALYMGRMLDESPRPDRDRIVRVRVEAPEHVDDTVLTCADGHRVYVHAKENLRAGDAAWKGVWTDFAAQYAGGDFVRERDRLRLHVGEFHDEHASLRELCNRARASDTPEEWQERLTAGQKKLVAEIGPLLGPGFTGGDEAVRRFLAHVEVEIRPLEEIEDGLVPSWMPATNQLPIVIFRLLRDRVGGKARHRDSFDAKTLRESLAREGGIELRRPADIGALREAVRACGALLRQHKNTVGRTGVHLRRRVVDQIVEWAAESAEPGGVGLLLDNAGRGKTVVLRDVLDALQLRGASVLAIKADQQLSGVTDPAELAGRLGLPEPVERVAARLAALGPTVVIVDQVDALSLSLARDQHALNAVLSTIARLRVIPGVVVLLSCRTFDRKTDPRLKRMEVDREFPLPLLDPGEVDEILTALVIEPRTLSPATRELLRTPLHLDLFASLASASEGGNVRLRGISSLQDLYSSLWEDIVLRPEPDGPSAASREGVLRLLTERMDAGQRTSVPRSVAHSAGSEDLSRAAEWLASAGLLVGTPTEWTFLHQTFFDYCYARFFVESGQRLSRVVLVSDQGLFARPQIVQVLSYLRGIGNPAYLAEVSTLLSSGALRFHLRDLLLRWIGSLPDPGDAEWSMVQRMLADEGARARVLGVLGGNPGWFARVRGQVLDRLLKADDDFVEMEVVWYLISLADVAQAEVVAVIREWMDRDEPWPRRVRTIMKHVGRWHTQEAIELYERLLASRPLSEIRHEYEIDDIAKADFVAGARIIRSVFDRILDGTLERDETERMWLGLERDLEVLNGSSVKKAVEIVSAAAPDEFLRAMLPWLERAVQSGPAPEPGQTSSYFTGDPLSTGLHTVGPVVHHALMESFELALKKLATAAPEMFAEVTGRLGALPYLTPQVLLARVLEDTNATRARDGLEFLLADPRRLRLGENDAYESRKLIEAIAPHLADDELHALERHILESTGKVSRWDRSLLALKWRGADQMHLLRSIPRHRLSPAGARTLAELERKFPEETRKSRWVGPVNVLVGPPIHYSSAERMDDAAWLRAMSKYAGFVERKEFLRGGARELARVLKSEVKRDPERFYQLALRTSDELDEAYAQAFIEGLAESGAPAELAFGIIRRFASAQSHETRRTIAWTLGKLAERERKLPEDMLGLLGGWIQEPPGEDETWWEQQNEDLSHASINTDRGAALRTLMFALAADPNGANTGARWTWIDYASADPSAVLRAAALTALVGLVGIDQERAIRAFRHLVADVPRLRDAPPFHEFIYWGAFGHFVQLEPHITELMHSATAESRQRGAELAVVGHISPLGLEDDRARELAAQLTDQAITGPVEWRRGAAHVFSENLVDGPTELCVAGLQRLLDDEDDDVRQLATTMIRDLRQEHVFPLGEFLLTFAGSRSLHEGLHELAEFLWEHGGLNPEWTLSMIRTILDNQHPTPDRGGWGGGDDLVRAVLRIYTDPTVDEQLRQKAMDLFDRLMDRFSGRARDALDEWDWR